MTLSVSVILPNYNHARWLPRALLALARQNPAPSEIIVVDDGSTDDSVAIIKRLQLQFSFIKLLRHERNAGAEAAVKTGLAAATGDLLLFAAADDFVLPGLVATARRGMEQYPQAAFFCSEVVLVDKDDEIVGFRPIMLPRSEFGFMSPAEVRTAIRSSDNWFVGTSVVYRHSRLAEIGYFDRSLATLQDAMATRLLAFRHGFVFAPQVLSAWRVIPDSLSARSALSGSANEANAERAEAWIREHFPEDVSESYVRLFDRRLRFNMARLHLVFRDGLANTAAIADTLQLAGVRRAILHKLGAVPGISSFLVLGWITLCTRPFGLSALLSMFSRTLTVNRRRRHLLQKQLKAGAQAPQTGPHAANSA